MFQLALILSIALGIAVALLGRFRSTSPVRALYSGFPRLDRLVAVLCGLTFVGLVLTGYYDLALLNRAMQGWVLLLHVGIGGAFAVLVAVFAFLRAEANAPLERTAPAASATEKTLFWVFVVCGLVLMMTAALAMVPWLGTPGQRSIVGLHKWTSLLSLVAGIGYFGYSNRVSSTRA